MTSYFNACDVTVANSNNKICNNFFSTCTCSLHFEKGSATLGHHPRSHFTKLLSRALFFGPCHCSYLFVPCLALRVHVAGDLNKTIVRSRRSHDFVHLRFTRAHTSETELSYAFKYFLKHSSYRIECFLKQWNCMSKLSLLNRNKIRPGGVA